MCVWGGEGGGGGGGGGCRREERLRILNFLAHQIRISACFTCAYKSYLTHVISHGAG